MKKLFRIIAIAALCISAAACGRIETGHSGVRTSWSKQVQNEEVKPGLYFAVTDSVQEFVTNEITLVVQNEKPQTLDKSYLKDLDYQFIYEVDPAQLAEMSVKYKSRHLNHNGDVYPMGQYVDAVVKSAMKRAVGEVDALEANSKTTQLQRRTVEIATELLKAEHLDDKIHVKQVIVNNVEIDPRLQDSILRNVTAKKDNETKDIEIDSARKESLRMAQLAQNASSDAYIKLLSAQTGMKIAEAVAAGKVNTIVIPSDFKGIVNAK